MSVRNELNKSSKISVIVSKPLIKSYSKEAEKSDTVKKVVLDL